MIYKHILAAYDGSDLSEKALTQAIKLAESTLGSRLTIVHVLYRPNSSFGGFRYVPPEAYQDKMLEYENEMLAHAKSLTAALPHTEVVMLQGNAAAAIVDYAHNHNCSLIVMGSRGLGAIKEWMLGSVSHYVVQKAQIPVLIVK